MTIKIDPRSRTVIVKIKNVGILTKEGIEFAAYTTGKQLVEATSKEILKGNKSGVVYTRKTKSGRRRKHRSSAAGQTHANMSGALRKSLEFDVSRTQLTFGYGVHSGTAPEYADFVEFGTKNMKARPSLQNGIKSQRRNFQNNIEREINKRLGSLGVIT